MTVPTVQCLTEIELFETTTKLHQIGGIVLIISAVQHDLVKRARCNYSFPPRPLCLSLGCSFLSVCCQILGIYGVMLS